MIFLTRDAGRSRTDRSLGAGHGAGGLQDEPGDQVRVVAHRHVPATGQRHHPCRRQARPGPLGLVDAEDPVAVPQPMVTGTVGSDSRRQSKR